MVSAETLFNYMEWTIPFTVRNDASDKQLMLLLVEILNRLIYSQ